MVKKMLIKDVRIVNAYDGSISSNTDILVENGMIKKIGINMDKDEICNVFDAKGAFASPGWVEAHTHFDIEKGKGEFDIMRTYPPDGITCAVDAGSRGPADYKSMWKKISCTPLLLKTYLHVAKNGCAGSGKECLDLDNIDKELFFKTYETYKDTIIGVKIRIDPRVNCDTKKTLRIAQEFATELNLPLIIHPTRCEDSLEEILSVLKKGDVMAHTYSLLKPCIIDENGQVKKCVREARERGVFFDLSHGSSNFSWGIGRKAVEQDFLVDVISTDLHAYNIRGPVCNLADTMTKCLHIGMDFAQIIRRVTVNAVHMLGIEGKSLAIEEGMPADFTIFKIEQGEFPLSDSMGVTEVCTERFTTLLTVLGNMMFYPRHQVYMTPDFE